jgi:rhodanese-related sulfurtransferase/nitrogen fixation-related uncharacterized protein
MNKTIKYILIGIASFFGVMIIIMLFMWGLGPKDMQYEMQNELNQKTPVQEIPILGYKNISTKELAVMLDNKDFTMVNVHIPYVGDIEGTDASIPFNEIADNLDKLPEDKSSKIVLYCQSGNMSAIAADTLSQLGYTNVYDVTGGMIQWQKDGNTLVQK